MSCRESVAAGLLVAVAGFLTSCSAGSTPPAATARTGRLAAVEAAHLCEVRSTNFADESDLDAGLRRDLQDAGFAYSDWRSWRASLAESPARAAQLAAATRGCG